MPVISVRTNEEEAKLFKSFSNMLDISLSEAFKHALLEKNEDEYDASDILDYLTQFENNPKTHSLNKLRKTYDL